MVNDVSLTAQFELMAYIQEELKDRRKSPRDDLLTALVEAELAQDGGRARRLTDEEAGGFANLLVTGVTMQLGLLLGLAFVARRGLEPARG